MPGVLVSDVKVAPTPLPPSPTGGLPTGGLASHEAEPNLIKMIFARYPHPGQPTGLLLLGGRRPPSLLDFAALQCRLQIAAWNLRLSSPDGSGPSNGMEASPQLT